MALSAFYSKVLMPKLIGAETIELQAVSVGGNSKWKSCKGRFAHGSNGVVIIVVSQIFIVIIMSTQIVMYLLLFT